MARLHNHASLDGASCDMKYSVTLYLEYQIHEQYKFCVSIMYVHGEVSTARKEMLMLIQ